MKNTVIRILLAFALVCVPSLLWAQANLRGINDKISSHFEGIFSKDGLGAQEDESEWLKGSSDAPIKVPLNIETTIYSEFTWIAKDDFRHSDQEIETLFGESILSLSKHLEGGSSLHFSAGYKFFSYNLNEVELPVIEHDRLEQFDLGVMYQRNIHPKWDLFGGVGMSDSYGSGPYLKRSQNVLGFMGFWYTKSPNLRFALGFSLSTNEAVQSGLFPLAMMEWKFNDRNRVLIQDGLTYEYAVTADWRNVLGFSAEYNAITVEIEDRVISGRMRSDLSIRADDYAANLFYRRVFKNGFVVSLKLGIGHIQEQHVAQESDELISRETEGAPGATFSLRYRF